MLNITSKIIKNIPRDFFSENEIQTLLGIDSDANRRHALVKRAIAKGELIRICRGYYCLSEELRRDKLNLFAIANRLHAPSYISMESALSHYQVIPEAIFSTISISTKRRKSITSTIGQFEYYQRATAKSLEGIIQIEVANEKINIASIEKAIFDYFIFHKKAWESAEDMIGDIRFDTGGLNKINVNNLISLATNYRSQKLKRFSQSLVEHLK